MLAFAIIERRTVGIGVCGARSSLLAGTIAWIKQVAEGEPIRCCGIDREALRLQPTFEGAANARAVLASLR